MTEPVRLSEALKDIPTPVILEITDPEGLAKADNGSWFTILGTGGDLMEWVDAFNTDLENDGIGKPVQWYSTIGCHVNTYAGNIPNPERDYFPHDLPILLFPLEGLSLGKLAGFKMAVGARWFDDVIANMRRS